MPHPFRDRYPILVGVILVSALFLGGCAVENPPWINQGASRSVPDFGHVFVIMMENKGYDQIIDSDQAPYINELARTYASASGYYAITHPSLPNYLALVSGSTQGIHDDCPDCSVDAKNLVDQLEEHGKSWRSYAEDMPEPCFNEGFGPDGPQGKPLYVRRHSPFMYFSDISNNPQRCSQVVPLSQFSADLKGNQVPDFTFISPNMIHDMHDGSVRDGDNWLASFVPQILDSAAWKDNGVLFLLWDEGKGNEGCCEVASGGHTAALVIAANGRRGYQSDAQYTHYSVLRTIEDSWQLGYLGEADGELTISMAEFFQ